MFWKRVKYISIYSTREFRCFDYAELMKNNELGILRCLLVKITKKSLIVYHKGYYHTYPWHSVVEFTYKVW